VIALYCKTECQDGTTAGEEECEDGNSVDNNGCSNNCVIQDGYICNKDAANSPGNQKHNALTLPCILWRRVVYPTHDMKNSLLQQQTCYRMMGPKKCTT